MYNFILAYSKMPIGLFSSRSTSTSTSLSAPASPRATEPNTAACATPSRRKSASCARSVSRTYWRSDLIAHHEFTRPLLALAPAGVKCGIVRVGTLRPASELPKGKPASRSWVMPALRERMAAPACRIGRVGMHQPKRAVCQRSNICCDVNSLNGSRGGHYFAPFSFPFSQPPSTAIINAGRIKQQPRINSVYPRQREPCEERSLMAGRFTCWSPASGSAWAWKSDCNVFERMLIFAFTSTGPVPKTK